MAKESSFDVVSEVDMMEVDNAFQQAARELTQRYDERAEVISGWVGHPALVDATPLLQERSAHRAADEHSLTATRGLHGAMEWRR